MKIKDLRKIMDAANDEELDVAVLSATDEYWGNIYGVAEYAEVRTEQTNGPKSGQSAKCLVIEAR